MEKMPFSSQVTFLYFNDLAAASEFFAHIIGLPLAMDAGWAKIYRASEAAFVGAVQKDKGSLENPMANGVMVSFTTQDVLAAHEKMRKMTPVSEIKDFPDIGLRSFFLEGPEGYTFEVQQFLNEKQQSVF